MTIDLRPWRRMLPVWLPAVVLCLTAAGFLLWQTSESGGRRAQVSARVGELEVEIARLEGLREATEADRQRVAEIEEQFGVLYGGIFRDLEERLTGILRAVGSATHTAGLLPESYSYSAKEDRETGFIRFGIQFQVEGEYPQIRRMLAELQSSPEFLVVEALSLSGESDVVSRKLRISVKLATFLAEADAEQVRRFTGGMGANAGGNDG